MRIIRSHLSWRHFLWCIGNQRRNVVPIFLVVMAFIVFAGTKSREPRVHPLSACVIGMNDLWGGLHSSIQWCVTRHTSTIGTDFYDLETGTNETISFLKCDKKIDKKEHKCKWISFLLDSDSKAVTQFETLYPGCELFATAPSPKLVTNFNGKVLPFYVGPEQTTMYFSIRPAPENDMTAVEVEPLVMVLEKYVKYKFFHFVTMDIQGGEYQFLEELKYGGLFDVAGVVFCQLEVKFYFDELISQIVGSSFNMAEFWLGILQQSPYVPIRATAVGKNYRRITLLHSKHKTCSRLFNYQDVFDTTRSRV